MRTRQDLVNNSQALASIFNNAVQLWSPVNRPLRRKCKWQSRGYGQPGVRRQYNETIANRKSGTLSLIGSRRSGHDKDLPYGNRTKQTTFSSGHRLLRLRGQNGRYASTRQSFRSVLEFRGFGFMLVFGRLFIGKG